VRRLKTSRTLARSSLALAVAGLLSAASGEQAHALLLSIDPTVGVGYADVTVPNVAAAPGQTTTKLPQAKDEFLSLGLSARLRLNGALMTQTWGYSLFATEYLGPTIPSNLSHVLTWQVTGTPSGRTTLSLTATAGKTSTSGATPVDATLGSTTAVAVGPSTQLRAALAEGVEYQPTGTQKWSELAGVSLLRTDVTPFNTNTGMVLPMGAPLPTTTATSLLLNVQLGAHRLAGRDTYSLIAQALSTTYLSAEDNGATGAALLNQGTNILGDLTVGWIREYSAAVSSNLQGGVLFLARPSDNQLAIGPAFNLALNYAALPWFATFSVFQQPVVNSFAGGTVIADGVLLRVSVPLDQRQQWTISGLGGYTYARALTPGKSFATLDRGYDLVTGGLTSTYAFERLPIFLALNYTGTYQRGSQTKDYAYVGGTRQLLWLSVGASFAFGEGFHGFARR